MATHTIRNGVVALCALTAVACDLLVPSGEAEEERKPSCGDGVKQEDEVCDGLDLGDATCSELGFGIGDLSCQDSCADFDRSACGPPETCGDGEVQDPELCDGGDLGGETCESLGRGPGPLGCLRNCADYDVSGCTVRVRCGDRRRQGDEICDGPDLGGQSCEALDLGQGELRCGPDCDRLDTSGCERAPSCPDAADCTGRECGPDPICGTSCGTCLSSGACDNGRCNPEPPTSLSCAQPAALHCDQTVSGDTTGAPDLLHDYAACAVAAGHEAGEHVYRLRLAEDQRVTLSLTASRDLDLLVLEGGCDTAHCADASLGQGGNERVELQGQAGVDLFVVVDGWQGAEDSYGLEVRCGEVCEPDCAGRVCGDDPRCGVSCGSCDGGAACYQGQCVDSGQLCQDYDDAHRLQSCQASGACAQPLACVDVGLVPLSSDVVCLDTRPCEASPTATCCGAGEFCGTDSFGGGEAFCCVPGEVLGTGTWPTTCADAGLDIGCQRDADCPDAWGRGRCDLAAHPPVCVTCLQDADCPSGAHCDPQSRACVACLQDSHCGDPALPACDTASHACVGCTADRYCGGSTPRCSLERSQCVACASDAHCGGAKPYCDTQYGSVCVACLLDEHCPAQRPYCGVSATCGECPSSLFGDQSCTGMVSGRTACYLASFVQTCNTDVECDEGRICDAPSGGYKTCLLPCGG